MAGQCRDSHTQGFSCGPAIRFVCFQYTVEGAPRCAFFLSLAGPPCNRVAPILAERNNGRVIGGSVVEG